MHFLRFEKLSCDFWVTCTVTCTEQQQDLHAQVLVMWHLQSDELVTDLQHLFALVGHEGQLHPLSERRERGGGGEGRRVEQVETAGEETEENRGKRETQILSSELFNSSCYLIPSKQPPQGRHYRRAGENWTVKSVLMDFYTSLPLTHSLHYFLPQKINAAHSPDSLWGLSFRAMYSFWLNGVLPTVTSSPFISIFTPVWVYEVHWEQLLTARSSLSA